LVSWPETRLAIREHAEEGSGQDENIGMFSGFVIKHTQDNGKAPIYYRASAECDKVGYSIFERYYGPIVSKTTQLEKSNHIKTAFPPAFVGATGRAVPSFGGLGHCAKR